MTTRLIRAETLQADLSLLSDSLQRYYRLGMEAEVLSNDKEASRNLAARYAKKYKLKFGSDHLLKARRFVQRLSNRECLKLLAQNCELTGKPLSWSHVRHLVSVADAARRYQLLKDTVQNSWITTQLIDAIQVRERRTRHPKAGGWPPIKPKTVEEGMLRLQRLSEKWSALYQLADMPNAVVATLRLRGSRVMRRRQEAQAQGFLDVLRKQSEDIQQLIATIEKRTRTV